MSMTPVLLWTIHIDVRTTPIDEQPVYLRPISLINFRHSGNSSSSFELDSSTYSCSKDMNPANSDYLSCDPSTNFYFSHSLPKSRKLLTKPEESYVALIARAILSSSNYQMLLVDIYQWITQEYPYFATLQSKAWRNSIRHNLSLNECFVRQKKSENGRGYYWSIHPASLDAFLQGDFRRRQARLRAKHANHSSIQSIPWLINTDLPLDYPTYTY